MRERKQHSKEETMVPNTAKDIVSAATKTTGGAHLGDIIFPRFRNATTKEAVLKALAASCQFPEDLLPEGLKPDNAWQYACRRATGMEDHLLRQISKTKGEITWGLVKEEKDENNNLLRYQQVSRLTLNRTTGNPTYSDPYNVYVRKVDAKFNELVGSVTTDDIRKMVMDICKDKNGVPVGTAWFVPAAHADLMRAMRALVEQLGESEMWLLPIYDSEEARESIGKATRADLQDQINEIKAEIEEFSAEQTRPSTLQRRLRKFEELRNTAKLYASMVSMVHTDLESQIGKLEKTVVEMLNMRQSPQDSKDSEDVENENE